MVRRADHDKVRNMLKDTITLLCKNGLSFRNKFTIEAVIGVTLDDEDVLLVSISEIVKTALTQDSSDGNSSAEDVESNISHRKKGHKRKRRKHSQHASRDNELNDTRYETNDNEVQEQNGVNEVNNLYSSPAYIVDSSNQNEYGHVEQEVMKEDVPSDVESNQDEDIVFVKQELENNWSRSQDPPAFPDFSDLTTSHPDLSLQSLSNMSGMSMVLPSNSHHQSIWQSMSSPRQQQQYSQAGGGPIVVTPSRLPSGQTSPTHREMNAQQHGQQIQKSSNHPHICSFCNKPCTSRSNLVMHENWHRGKYNYECQYCGKKFMSTTSLKGHLPAHTGVKEFKCNLCSQEYKYKIQLKKHLLDAHQIESPRERRTKKLLGH